MTIRVKRIYEPADTGDGARFLVDRLWPRGVSKERADLTAWLKAIAPSDDLRRRYHGETVGSVETWADFQRDYAAELAAGGAKVEAELVQLRDAAAKGPITLLYAAKDEARNNAVALLGWLNQH